MYIAQNRENRRIGGLRSARRSLGAAAADGGRGGGARQPARSPATDTSQLLTKETTCDNGAQSGQVALVATRKHPATLPTE